jgi:hypothetical protein
MSIGIAKMDDDGTLVLELRAIDASGLHGEAQLRYSPDHEQYQAILAHVGDLAPGQVRAVEPWPDESYVA